MEYFLGWFVLSPVFLLSFLEKGAGLSVKRNGVHIHRLDNDRTDAMSEQKVLGPIRLKGWRLPRYFMNKAGSVARRFLLRK